MIAKEMTDLPDSELDLGALRAELRFVARRNVYGFDLAAVPTLVDAVARLRGQRPVSIEDVRRAIIVGVEAFSDDSPLLHQIALWSFGIVAESRKHDLLIRQECIGKQVARSSSSVRQTDLPQIITRLIDFLALSPPGILGPPTRYRSARGAYIEEQNGIRLISLTLRIDLTPSEYQASPLTVAGDIEALRRVTQFGWLFPGKLGYSHTVCEQSEDGRLRLLSKPNESHVSFAALYAVEPAWTRGERYRFCLQHQYRDAIDNGRHKQKQGVRCDVELTTDYITELRLIATTPTDTDCRPHWHYGLGRQALIAPDYQPMPLIDQDRGVSQWGVAIQEPSGSDVYGICVIEPLFVTDSYGCLPVYGSVCVPLAFY